MGEGCLVLGEELFKMIKDNGKLTVVMYDTGTDLELKDINITKDVIRLIPGLARLENENISR